jgi:uncharacterized protein (TIGR03066 family)
MRAFLGCTLAALVCGGTLTADDKKDEKIDAQKLLGKWVHEEKEGGVEAFEFTKDGKLIITRTDGKGTKTEGTYKLDGDKLTVTTKERDKEETRTVTILKLTDTEMVSRAGKEKVTLVRLKDK